MSKMDSLMLNKLHSIQVEILDEIVRICDSYNLDYFLIGGTLLGAIRHKGFIPWDDDLDIVMPRYDYDKFIALCDLEMNNKYILDSFENNSGYCLPFIKIRKKIRYVRKKRHLANSGRKSTSPRKGTGYHPTFVECAVNSKLIFWIIESDPL
jgi:lipopolysaccharide cholinephosphotransferase